MPVSLEDMMKELSPERRTKIEGETARLISEVRLSQLRKSLGLTQKALAERLKVNQASLSEIEARADSKLSTIAKVVEGMGGKLRVLAEMPNGEVIHLAFGRNVTRPRSEPKPLRASGGTTAKRTRIARERAGRATEKRS